jgi:hypothetical protein
MKTVAVEYKVYNYNELSEEAKEKVKEWYLKGQESFMFTDDCKEDLYSLFGKNNLDVQYSLSYCQGDGFNIYGRIDAKNIFNCLEMHNGGSQLKRFEDMLTEDEKKIILEYAEECGDIEIPMNRRYCYSLADYIDIAEEWVWRLDCANYTDINEEVLNKFEKLVRGIFAELCRSYEKQGYEFFYEISDEDLEEACDCNGWEFLEDGTIF